jgi:hypothetical protein
VGRKGVGESSENMEGRIDIRLSLQRLDGGENQERSAKLGGLSQQQPLSLLTAPSPSQHAGLKPKSFAGIWPALQRRNHSLLVLVLFTT